MRAPFTSPILRSVAYMSERPPALPPKQRLPRIPPPKPTLSTTNLTAARLDLSFDSEAGSSVSAQVHDLVSLTSFTAVLRLSPETRRSSDTSTERARPALTGPPCRITRVPLSSSRALYQHLDRSFVAHCRKRRLEQLSRPPLASQPMARIPNILLLPASAILLSSKPTFRPHRELDPCTLDRHETLNTPRDRLSCPAPILERRWCRGRRASSCTRASGTCWAMRGKVFEGPSRQSSLPKPCSQKRRHIRLYRLHWPCRRRSRGTNASRSI